MTWQIRKISDFCYITDYVANGSFASLKENVKYLKTQDYAILIRLRDFTRNWNNDFVYVSKKSYDFLKKSSLKPGDLIMSNVGEPGKCFQVPNLRMPMTLGPNAILIRPNSTVLEKFLIYYFQSNIGKAQIESITSGATQKKFNKTSFKKIGFPIPEINEQKRIVKKLDEVFEKTEKIRENTFDNLSSINELFQSFLQSIFSNNTWERKSLREISIEFGRGKSKHRPRNDKKLYGGKYPFIQTGDIKNSNHLIKGYSQTYNDVGLAQSKLWPKGAICLTIAANIAETGVLTFDACFPDSVIGIVVNPKIADANYVEFLLQFFKAHIQSKGKGFAQQNINLQTLENETFPFPDLNTQKAIVKKVNSLLSQMEKMKNNYNQKLNYLEEFKKSILNEAFSGKL